MCTYIETFLLNVGVLKRIPHIENEILESRTIDIGDLYKY